MYYCERKPGANSFKYNEHLQQLCYNGDIFLDGYFQTYKYFANYKDSLKLLFLKKKVQPIDGYFIHVRRCDYVNHHLFTFNYKKYFKRAIQHFPKDSAFYVVSDDTAWCKNFSLFKNYQIMELDTLDTLHFMASCRGGICANSSFSWWGAWLGPCEIVTMPRQWINNGLDTSDVFFENVKVIDF